jgi:hypothetical protein
MAYFGVDKQVRIDEINLTFKNIIRNKGGIGLRNLQTLFTQFDKNGNGKLDQFEFEQALAKFG